MGYISLLLKKFFPSANITAFEPIENTFHLLENNIALNKADIHAVQSGLSDKSGVFTYFYYPKGSGNASMQNLSQRNDVMEVKAVVTTLEQYVQMHDIKKIDFIKIDVEGAEFNVLKGGQETIRNMLPIMYIELLRKWSATFGYHPNDVLEWLAQMGYGCYIICDSKLKKIYSIHENTAETNFVFLHERKHKVLIRSFVQ